jgi:hypothetical protein
MPGIGGGGDHQGLAFAGGTVPDDILEPPPPVNNAQEQLANGISKPIGTSFFICTAVPDEAFKSMRT